MIEGRDFAAASTVGTRERQEDDWGIDHEPATLEGNATLLAVLADGMGGMPNGDVASAIAVRTFLESYAAIQRPSRDRLRHALAHANREVGIAAESDPTLAGMGTTLIAALFFADRCQWLSIGDSLILHCRNGHVRRINPLHIYANVLDDQVRYGKITPSQAANDPDREALTSVVQGTALVEVAQGCLELHAGDMLMLASDGLATLRQEEIGSICCAADISNRAEDIANAMIRRVNSHALGGQDNATVVVVRQRCGEAAHAASIRASAQEPRDADA